MPSHEGKSQPPSFTALQQHTADNYRALAEAMGLMPDGITVDELLRAVISLKGERDALRKRADGYEAAVAEIAAILEQPVPVWTEGSEVWALSLWQHVSRQKKVIEKAEKFIEGAECLVEDLMQAFTERIDQLEEELKLARANEGIAILNEESLAQFHEAAENQTRDRFQVRAAKWKYRFLKAQRMIRQLQADLELHRVTYQYATTGLLADYDRLTLALSYKWGDAKKKQFLKDIEDDAFMAKLEARWERKFPAESGERSEA